MNFGDDLKYKISFKSGLNDRNDIMLLEKYYDDEISEVEILKASKDFKKYTFEAMKKAIEEVKEK